MPVRQVTRPGLLAHLPDFAPYIYHSRHCPPRTEARDLEDLWQRVCFSLILLHEGTAIIIPPVGGPAVTVAAGQAALTDPGSRLRLNPRSRLVLLNLDIVYRPSRSYTLNDNGVLRGNLGGDRHPQPTWRDLTGHANPVRVPAEMAAETADMIQHLATAYCRGPHALLSANLEVGGWLLRFADRQSHSSDVPAGDDLVAVVDRLIGERMRDGITVGGLADTLQLNPDYLGRRYRELRGIGLHETIARRRLTMAQRTLAGRARSIAEVATFVGMNSASAFARWFKARTGLSPRAWRRRRHQSEAKR